MRRAAVVIPLIAVALLYWWPRHDEAARAERQTADIEEPELVRTRRQEEREPLSVEVWIKRADETGIEGVKIRIVGEREIARGETNEDGYVGFKDVPATRLEVWGLQRNLGTLYPAAGETRLVHTVETLLALTVRVKCDGARRLPEGLVVYRPVLVDPVYDAARAEVRGWFEPPVDTNSMFVSARAPGYATTEVVQSLRPARSPFVVNLELLPTTEVTVEVEGPPWVLSVIKLEVPRVLRRRIDGNKWRDMEPGPADWKPGKGGKTTLLATQQIIWKLLPGRYRLRLINTPAVFHDFKVARQPVRLAVDLSRAETQDIRLRAPEPIDLRSAVLVVDWLRIPYGGNQFSIILPGDRVLTVEPRHPLLKAVEPLELVRAGDPITIDLEARPLVRFAMPGGAGGPVGVVILQGRKRVWHGEAEGYAGGYAVAAEPGRYTFHFNIKGFKRYARPVTVPAGGVDLGELPIR